jgi:hypothetical protein
MGVCVSKKVIEFINSEEEYISENLEILKIKANELKIKEYKLILLNQELYNREEKINILINQLTFIIMNQEKENVKENVN